MDKYELTIAVKELDDETLYNYRRVVSSVLGEQGLWSSNSDERPNISEGWSDEEGTPAIIVEWHNYMENFVEEFTESAIGCYNDNWFVNEKDKTIDELQYISHTLYGYTKTRI